MRHPLPASIPKRRRVTIYWMLAVLAWCVVTMPAARALEIRETRWGFDGTTVPGRLNLLSVLVTNPSATAFDGTLRLEQNGGLLGYVGTPLVQSCYLAPFAARWVQFFPFIGDNQSSAGEEWTLRWGNTAATQQAVDGPKLGPPARVRLVEGDGGGDNLRAARSPENQPNWRAFPESLFPVTAAGTDGLDSLALDHAPQRWEPARRQALLDWLRRGGGVHLYPDPTAGGRLPEFAGELAALNSPLPRWQVGAGVVFRHDNNAAENATLPAAPELRENKEGTSGDLEPIFFRALASLTRPDVNWALLYTLSALYLLALGPGHYFFFGKRRDYRMTLLVFALGVAAFSALFAVIGRRGYGESNQIWTLTLARPLGEGRCDLTQWTSAFMTRGDTYVFTQPGAPAGGLFSSADTVEKIPGLVFGGGRESAFQAEIPLYSARPFTHRAVVSAKAGEEDGGLRLRTLERDRGGKLTRLEIDATPGFLAEGKFTRGWARHDGWMYPLRTQTSGGRSFLELGPAEKFQTETDYFSQQAMSAASSIAYQKKFRTLTELETSMAEMLPLVVARATGGNPQARFRVPTRAPDGPMEMDVFVCTLGVPASFRLAEAHGPLAENGITLFQQRLALPDASRR